MYNYSYSYNYYGNRASSLFMFSGLFWAIWSISILISVFNVICLWRVFTKAGKPGWAAIVPFYNIIVLLEITNMPMWYIVLFIIPIGNIIASILVYIELAHRFGKSTAFGVGLVFLSPIFMAILAFDKNTVFQVDTSNSQFNNQSQYNQQYSNNQTYTNLEINQNTQMYNQTSDNQLQQSNNYFCSNCGSKIEHSQKFCSNCGSRL